MASLTVPKSSGSISKLWTRWLASVSRHQGLTSELPYKPCARRVEGVKILGVLGAYLISIISCLYPGSFWSLLDLSISVLGVSSE